MRLLILLLVCFSSITGIYGQTIASAAVKFVNSLSQEQKAMVVYPFESEERYRFNYTPIQDRKGLPFEQMSEQQKNLAISLLKTCLNDGTVKKVKEIIALEVILKQIEKRKADDRYRDPGKYYLAIFGTPGEKSIWGWRFEGHHVSFNFSTKDNALVAGTPGFLGSNPAIVQDGPQKGKEILKEEKEKGLALLHSLSSDQIKIAVSDTVAPAEIITGNERKAMIREASGISYSQLSTVQQEKLMELISLYLHRYKKQLADKMRGDIRKAGLDKLYFTWAGDQTSGIGHPHYYRIQGPTLIIEYDNTQNNANHVHTVVRDLLNDFGGDALLEHYKAGHDHD